MLSSHLNKHAGNEMAEFTVQDIIADLMETATTLNTVTAQQIEDSRKERDYKRIAGYAGYSIENVKPDYDLGSWLSLDADVDAEGEGESRDDIARRENDILDQQERRS